MCLPFSDLPDRTLEKGEHAGFQWEITHNHSGHRCGYVRVEPSHPWFEMGYNDVSADVHGGLTFAEHGKACPTHGEAAEWWLGFDCGHGGDAPDPSLPTKMRFGSEMLGQHGEIRDQWYVRNECRNLCEQAAAAT